MRPQRQERLHRNVWVAGAASFLTDVSSEMIQNVLPLFLANVLGVRTWAVGVVEGVAESTASLLKLYSGWLSDRLGARKSLAVGGYAVSALSKPFYLLATSWPVVAVIRWSDRVGKGIRTAPRDALLADSVHPSRRGLAYGIHRAADTAGAVVGLLVTIGVVSAVQGQTLRLEGSTFRALVLWSVVPALLAVLVLAAGARDIPAAGAQAPRPRPTLRGMGPGFVWFVVASAVFQAGNSSDAFLILRAQERGLDVVDLMWMLLAFNVVYAAVAGPAGSLADRVPRKWVVFGAWCAYAAVYGGFALARTASHIVALYTAYGAYHGLVAGAAKALVVDLVDADRRGTAFGAYHATMGLISLPASLVAGLLWEGFGPWAGWGPAAPFAFGSATALVAGAILALRVPGAPVTAPIPVVAALVRREGRYLVGRRPPGKRHGGLWEFPGGKVRDGEDWEGAARRELLEELDMTVASVGRVVFSAEDPASRFVIHFLEVDGRGTPRAAEHSEVAWCTPAELRALPMAPADAKMVIRLLAEPPG